jgi:arsenate reductase
MTDDMLQHTIDSVCERLAGEFADTFSPGTVSRYVNDTSGRWAEATVTTYLPVMIERFSRERLRALAKTEGKLVADTPEVLFVCVHNAGRSQMAAALLDHHAQGRVHVLSAGSEPADRVNPAVVAAMDEVGIDVAKEFPKPLTDEVIRAADVVITMGCGDACPIYPGTRYLDWELTDPAGKGVDEVRPIREEIDRRVRELLAELVPSPG